jgi:predicted nucleotidyltransferase
MPRKDPGGIWTTMALGVAGSFVATNLGRTLGWHATGLSAGFVMSILGAMLLHCCANPSARLHLRDLAGRLDIDPANLSKELRRLEIEGLFRSEVSGRHKHFQLNREYPLFAELRSIVSKTIGAPSLIAQSLKKMEGIEDAYLYGASNQLDAASDIDVLVIGARPGEALAAAMRKIERQLGREVSCVKGPRPCCSESTTYGGSKVLFRTKIAVFGKTVSKLFPTF